MAGTETNAPKSESVDSERTCLLVRLYVGSGVCEGEARGVGGENKVAKMSSLSSLLVPGKGINGAIDIGDCAVDPSMLFAKTRLCYGEGMRDSGRRKQA